MALIGSTVDPRMFVQDYSGFANAAAIRAAGMMNFGQQIGGAIGDYAKESKQLKGEIAKGKSALAFAKTYHPELAEQIDQLGQIFQDPSKSVVEQAAAGSQMGDFVAAILGGEQFKKEMDLRGQEMDIRRQEAGQNSRMNDFRLTEAEMALSERQSKRESESRMAPVQLAAAVNMAKSIPGFQLPYSGKDIEAAFNESPETQTAMAQMITALLPERAKRELKTIPATINGQPGELPVLIDEYGNMDQLAMGDGVLPPKGAIGGDGMEAPPADITTNEGAILPANESKLVGEGKSTDGTLIEIWNYQGRNYTTPKQTGPAEQGPQITPGRVVATPGALSEKDRYEIGKDQRESVAKQSDALAKSQEFVSTLDRLEKHPGFNELFGTAAIPWQKNIPGSEGAGANAVFKQLEGKGFLESIQSMKGMGALSNAEGEKVASAYLGITPEMPEKEVRARIKEIKTMVQTGMERIKNGLPGATDPRISDTSALRSKLLGR